MDRHSLAHSLKQIDRWQTSRMGHGHTLLQLLQVTCWSEVPSTGLNVRFIFMLLNRFLAPPVTSIHLVAVGGGANLVRNVDTTFAREASSQTKVHTRDGFRSIYQALASGPAVLCGGGRVFEVLNTIAARRRQWASTSQVVDARGQLGCYVTTRQPFYCHGRSHQHAHQHQA